MIKYIILTFLLISCGASSLNGDGLVDETIVGYGNVSGIISDGADGSVISGATVTILGTSNTATTNASGSYSFTSVPVGVYYLQVVKSGYITQTITFVLRNDIQNLVNVSLLTTSYSAGKIVIVLTWNQTPQDLDAHIYVPTTSSTTTKVNYSTPGDNDGVLDAVPFAGIDVDDTNGDGPETITLKLTGTKPYYPRTYRYYVATYAHGTTPTDYFMYSNAKVRVYKEGLLTNEFSVSNINKNKFWHVFDIDSEGNIQLQNKYSDTVPAELY